MDLCLMQTSPGNDSISKKSKKQNRKQKQRAKMKAMEENGPKVSDQAYDIEFSDKMSGCRVTNFAHEEKLLEKNFNDQAPLETPKIAAGSADNSSEGNKVGKKKKKKKKKKNRKTIAEVVAEIQNTESMDTTRMATGSTENVTEGVMSPTLIVIDSTENIPEAIASGKRKRKVKRKKRKTTAEVVLDAQNMETMDPIQIVIGSIENVKEGVMDPNLVVIESSENVTQGVATGKRKRKAKRKTTAEGVVDIQNMESMDCTQIVTGSTENVIEGVMDANLIVIGSRANFTEGAAAGKRKRKRKRKAKRKATPEVAVDIQNMETTDPTQIVIGSTENGTEGAMDPNLVVIGSTENVIEGAVTSKRKRKAKRKKRKIKDVAKSTDPADATLNVQTSKENHVGETASKLTGKGPQPNQTAEEKEKFSDVLKEVKNENVLYQGLVQYPIAATMTANRRKLLVLDLNGLLADIVMPAPKDRRADTHIWGRAIFRRPFCDEFLKFCFLNFDVAIWSSRSKRIIDRVVDYLLRDLKHKLIFCWDMTQCTQTGYRTLENRQKPLVCKELRKIWESDCPNLPWKKGDYDESNTLLLDDSPYKALLNPLNSAIFPKSYHYEDKRDSSLGCGGDIRVYLEGLLAADHVQKYVAQHPFGQGAITETNSSWDFYSSVLQTLSLVNRLENNTPQSLPTLA